MFFFRPLILLLFLTSLAVSSAAFSQTSRLTGDNVLVLYKNSSFLSKEIADYYAKKRSIPAKQLVGIDIYGEGSTLSQQRFEAIEWQIKSHLTPKIKVIVMTWNTPYRVECMSITSAFSLGFDRKYCSRNKKPAKRCNTTAISPFYNADSEQLWQKKDLRLSIMLSGKTFEDAKKLIDRGVAADFTQPHGKAYFVRTTDTTRSTRWPSFKKLADTWPEQKGIKFNYVDQTKGLNARVEYKKDVMFYMTGAVKVPKINSNKYLPGAIADHLTSAGGTGIGNVGQMSIYRWLEAGVTGSYGAVVEPCNFPNKFPNPLVLVPNYLSGDTLIEAYWKSVQQPGEGIFVGEPLACPWCDKPITAKLKSCLKDLNSCQL